MRPALILSIIAFVGSSVRAEDFPRRVLVVHVGNPLYLNSLTSKAPDGPDRIHEASTRLAESLRVPSRTAKNPNIQLFVLRDTDTPPGLSPPTKPAIVAAVRSFCETSRAQDRVLLYFAGHAFEKNGKAYFAPIEGDPHDPASLVAVAELYDLLKACKATQKVVVWDVCRRNPARVAVRPDAGPMSEALTKSLSVAPVGVQVILSCSPGEHALEYSLPKGSAGLFAGSALLDSLRQAFEDRASEKKPDANDPLPVAEAFPAIEKHVASAAKAFKVKQTPKLVGKPAAQFVPFDPKETSPVAVKFLALKDDAPVGEVKAILDELALPPLGLVGSADPLPSLAPLITRGALKPYLPDVSVDDILKDVEKYKLRATVLRAFQTIRDTSLSVDPRAPKPLTAVPSPVTDEVKRRVQKLQEPLALTLAQLELTLADLESVEKLRKNEPKRWQAHYDFALAQVRVRIARLSEYNLILGHIRTETLPELRDGATGWRLVPTDTMQSKRDVRKFADDAADGFKALAADHKGTPWDVLAKRALLTPPGLKWEAYK